MTTACPRGHESVATDYCDTCGTPLAPRPTVPDASDLIEPEPVAVTATPGEPCPRCGTPRVGDDTFCEDCGYDFVTQTGGAPAATVTEGAAARWEIVVTADRAQYDAREVGAIAFPDVFTPRRYRLDGDEVHIGRRSARRHITPDIDLAEPPEDTGVSHVHAVLRRIEDGGYTVTDLGSSNGTTVNDGPTLLPDTPVHLSPGDRIQVGAWTTLVIGEVGGD